MGGLAGGLADNGGLPASVVTVSSPKFTSIVVTPSGADDSAQINAAITSVAGNGEVRLGPGTFLLNTATLAMPRSAAGFRLRGAGRGVTILTPAAAVNNTITFPYVADYDTYQNIALEDFTIDCGNLALPTAGQGIVGNLVNGGIGNRVNFNQINFRRINVLNLALRTQPQSGSFDAFVLGSHQGGTTVAAGSNGVAVSTFAGAGTLSVVTTTGFPASGQLRVQVTATPTGIVGTPANASYATLSYTGTSGGNTFTGVNLVSGAGTLATGYMVMEGTQNTITNVVWEDLRVNGANNGFVIISDRISGTSNVGTNHYIDEVHWNRLYHDCGGTRVSGDQGGGGQVGGSAQGGTYRVSNCTFKNAGDTYEFDGMQALYVTDTVVEDCVNGLFANNFNNPVNPGSQTAVLERCHLRWVNMAGGGGIGSGFCLGPVSSQYTGYNTLGHAIVRDCTYTSYAPQIGSMQGSFISAGVRYVARVTVENATIAHEGANDTGAGTLAYRPLQIQPLCNCYITLRGIRVRIVGATTNATQKLQPIFIGTGTSGTNTVLNIDGVDLYYNVSGLGGTQVQFITVSGNASSTYQGAIGRAFIQPGCGADATPIVLSLSAAAAYPILTTLGAGLTIRDCDFSNGPGGTDVSVGAGTKDANAARTFFCNNRWGAGPSLGKVVKTNNGYFVSTSFTTATWNQYVGGFAANLAASAGSAVTAIDISPDGGTTVINVLTQASGAIATPVNFRIDNGYSVRMTFTTTAPTLTVRPEL